LIDNLTQIFMDSITSFNQYKGTGAYFTLFFISMIFLSYFSSKANPDDRRIPKKNGLIYTVYFPLVAFLMILNPLVAGPVIRVIKNYVYWRAFWIIPMTIIIAIAMAFFVDNVPSGSRRIIAAIACIAVIIISGRFIYREENYQKPTNPYKIPEEPVAICLMIRADTPDYASVAVPQELVPYIRQYDATIKMPYGRSVSGKYPAIIAELASGSPDIDSTRAYLDTKKVNYFVFYSETPDDVIYPDWCSPVGSAGDYNLVRVNG